LPIPADSTVPVRATVTLDIPERGMEGLWLDPFTGRVLQKFTADSGPQTLTIPDFQVDIALRIRAAGSNWTPVADAGTDQGVVDTDDDGREKVTLDASRSNDPDGTIASYVWTEDGSQVAAGVQPTVSFPVGTHALTLAVTDDQGATDTAGVVVKVDPANAPTITVLTPRGEESYAVGQTITVTWTSKNVAGNVRIDSNHGGYRWGSWEPSAEDDGNWTSFALPDGVAKYPATGWKFRVAPASERGPASESGVFSIHKLPPTNLLPVASPVASPTGGDAPLQVQFHGSGSSDPDGTIVRYHWDFGNGADSNEADPVYVYEQPGTYTVTLTVTDDAGATGTATISISVGGDVRRLSLTPLADSWIQDEGGKNRDGNMGVLDLMAIGGRWQSTYFRGLIRFDWSSIPAAATVTDARLRLYHTVNAVEGSNVNDISAYVVLKDWKEREVTWNNYATRHPWTQPGAAAIGQDRDGTVLATRSFRSATPINQYYDFDVTSAFRDHAGGAGPQYGFILVGKEAPAANRYFTGFSSKESTVHPALLEVAYTMPPAIQGLPRQ
jgi:PKD repeat protein